MRRKVASGFNRPVARQRLGGTIELVTVTRAFETRGGEMPYVRTDLRIHYRAVGDGPPVVWHTGGCGDGEMWELGGYLDRLPGYTHVLMDHRGRGRSDAPIDMAGHHMSRYVADALAVLDDAGADTAAFVGYSFGACVGFALGLSAPRRLTGLVALDSFPDPADSPDALRAEAHKVLARGTRDVIEEFVAAEREPVPAWLVEHLCTTDSLSFAGGLEAQATAPNLWASTSSLDVSVLLLLGIDDEGQREAVLGRQLVQDLPYGELVTLHAAHLAAFHRVDLTSPLIARFLSEVSPRP
jgi:pimeloyl-ACP methyl ester carboxylesterase